MPESILTFLKRIGWTRDDIYNGVLRQGIKVWHSFNCVENEVIEAYKTMRKLKESGAAAMLSELIVTAGSIADRKDEVSQRSWYDCFPVVEIDLTSALKLGILRRCVGLKLVHWYGYVTLAGDETCILQVSYGRNRSVAKSRARAWVTHLGNNNCVPVLVGRDGESLEGQVSELEPE